MTERYDAVTSRKDKSGKWRSTRIGVAFPGENGRFNVVLSALPLTGNDGQAYITLFPAEDKDKPKEAAPRGNDMSDEIPF
ncbi:hypothetical protein [Afipia carboxidovorans]|uniref:hypothetical protein n=1 Tax=Afipia carboxidovorans TaxID=40137 RepID=UPI003093A0B9|nr:hypothetical protein CRBSH125_09770 [Afipia carboxidovorans]BEV47325.1 hypothetical protein CRBSH125_35080 [Afipia carboxidovorans]